MQGHAACPDLQRHFISLGRVGGFDPTVKAEAAVVGDPNGFFVSVEADDSADWSEDFFLCDGHDVFDVIEQGKLGEEALGQVLGAAAAMYEPRAFVAAKANEVLDFRSEEHTSGLPSLMRKPYARFCLKKKKKEQKTI